MAFSQGYLTISISIRTLTTEHDKVPLASMGMLHLLRLIEEGSVANDVSILCELKLANREEITRIDPDVANDVSILCELKPVHRRKRVC